MQILFSHHQFLLFSFVGFLALSISDQGTLSRADEVLPIDLRQIAVQMQRSTETLKTEVKANFKGARKYGKLLSVVAKIRSRSASMIRKVDRELDYRLPGRDAEKIKNLAYELGAEYDTALEFSKLGKGRPIEGATDLAADQISILITLAEQLQFVSNVTPGFEPRVISRQTVSPELVVHAPYDPAVDEAPGRPESIQSESVRSESEPTVVLEPVMRSVWEK